MATSKKKNITKYKYLAQQLRKRRLNLGLSQVDVSKKLKYINSNFISTFEGGLAGMPVAKLGIVSNTYNLDHAMLAMASIKYREPDMWEAVKVIIDSDIVREGMTVDQIETEVDDFVDRIGDLSTAATR